LSKITDISSKRREKEYLQKEELITITLNELEAMTYMGILRGLYAVALEDDMWNELREDILENEGY
jgi:hypothetical protein